jgi:antitoxin ParD1/3/4
MDVSLTKELERYLREQVDSGLYADASEVIREALRRKIAADRHEHARVDALRAAIDEADADLAAGRFRDYGPDFFETLHDPVDRAAG